MRALADGARCCTRRQAPHARGHGSSATASPSDAAATRSAAVTSDQDDVWIVDSEPRPRDERRRTRAIREPRPSRRPDEQGCRRSRRGRSLRVGESSSLTARRRSRALTRSSLSAWARATSRASGYRSRTLAQTRSAEFQSRPASFATTRSAINNGTIADVSKYAITYVARRRDPDTVPFVEMASFVVGRFRRRAGVTIPSATRRSRRRSFPNGTIQHDRPTSIGDHDLVTVSHVVEVATEMVLELSDSDFHVLHCSYIVAAGCSHNGGHSPSPATASDTWSRERHERIGQPLLVGSVFVVLGRQAIGVVEQEFLPATLMRARRNAVSEPRGQPHGHARHAAASRPQQLDLLQRLDQHVEGFAGEECGTHGSNLRRTCDSHRSDSRLEDPALDEEGCAHEGLRRPAHRPRRPRDGVRERRGRRRRRSRGRSGRLRRRVLHRASVSRRRLARERRPPGPRPVRRALLRRRGHDAPPRAHQPLRAPVPQSLPRGEGGREPRRALRRTARPRCRRGLPGRGVPRPRGRLRGPQRPLRRSDRRDHRGVVG